MYLIVCLLKLVDGAQGGGAQGASGVEKTAQGTPVVQKLAPGDPLKILGVLLEGADLSYAFWGGRILTG